MAIYGWKSSRRIRESRRGYDCLVYSKKPTLCTLCQEFLLINIQDDACFEAEFENGGIVFWCLPSFGSCQNDFPSIIINITFGLPGTRMNAGDLDGLAISWLTLSALNYLVSFSDSIHQGGWSQHVTGRTRNCVILCLIFKMGLTHVQTWLEAGLPVRWHLPVICSLMSPIPNR